MKLSQEATRVWRPGKPFSPHQTKPKGECFGGAAVASAMPTCSGPEGVDATIGPPLSPEQTVRWIGRLKSLPLIFLIATRPERFPASQSSEVGTGQKPCTKTSAAVSTPILGLRCGAGFLAPNPATETLAPGPVSTESADASASWIGGAL